MPELRTSSDRIIAGPVTLVADSVMRLKITGKPGEQMPFHVAVLRAPLVAIDRLDNRIGPHFATFRLRGLVAGDTEIEITASAGGAPLRVAVRVLPGFALPPGGTDAGMLTRLFLAEVRTPGGAGYSLATAEEAMGLMRVVLENRRAHPSARWGSAGATSLRDVVRARGQFAGFEGYPTLSPGMEAMIANIVSIANNASDNRQPVMRAHVELAARMAEGMAPRDPSGTGLYWWRTEGSGAPGQGVTAYKTVLGNSFYREGR